MHTGHSKWFKMDKEAFEDWRINYIQENGLAAYILFKDEYRAKVAEKHNALMNAQNKAKAEKKRLKAEQHAITMQIDQMKKLQRLRLKELEVKR